MAASRGYMWRWISAVRRLHHQMIALSRKRAMGDDATALRDKQDGRCKRVKTDAAGQGLPAPPSTLGKEASKTGQSLNKSIEEKPAELVSAEGSSSSKDKGKAKAAMQAVCASCLDFHQKFDVLELACKSPEEFEKHAYCRECLEGLFDSSITDSSIFHRVAAPRSFRCSRVRHSYPRKRLSAS
ncbi:hypothetical protein BU26DRAFT_587523 [Trematosphaeria pertusa]|uniref:RING-type domain-containing protein n=1 Tax=Trematosphaeria pertusa TaxID=390896 RepID=A0A6A6IQI1_9PLEO|nr:uncharacterized protein BU26DRAFT_587523 [Trematosphaeria pertusa]KAF2252814.1 hypothetical protein BU26DRAFT_587523 [Trematosphaeria pertusa]